MYAPIIVFHKQNSASSYVYNKIGCRKISFSQNCTDVRLFLSSGSVCMIFYISINSKGLLPHVMEIQVSVLYSYAMFVSLRWHKHLTSIHFAWEI